MQATATTVTQRRDVPVILTREAFLEGKPFHAKGTICTGSVKLVRDKGTNDWLHVNTTNSPLCRIDKILNHGFSFNINVLGNVFNGFTAFNDCVLVR